jgi:hypothetical protein
MPKFEMNRKLENRNARRHNRDGKCPIKTTWLARHRFRRFSHRLSAVYPPSIHRLSTVYPPFIHRLLTVIHRFLPFLPFSKTVRELDQALLTLAPARLNSNFARLTRQ